MTNREDGQQDDTQDANDDRALMWFEFIEVIVRIAIAKFIQGQLKKTDLDIRYIGNVKCNGLTCVCM